MTNDRNNTDHLFPGRANPYLGDRAKEEALDRVESHSAVWMEAALKAIKGLALTLPYFTADEVWWRLDDYDVEPPSDPRAMGAAIRRAVREELILSTDRMQKSRRPENHRRPITVYQSRLWRG